MIRKRNEQGSTVALAVSIALAAAVLIAAATRSLLFSSHQVVYFDAMNRAYRLAETGLVESMGRLAVDPSFYISTPSLVNDVPVSGEGTYSVVIATADNVITSGYYFITTASVTAGGHVYASRLHTYLRISNVGKYFWASAQSLELAAGTDASGGLIYSPYLTFDTVVGKTTKVDRAEYMNSVSPPLSGVGNYGAPLSGSFVEITDPANGNKPIQVSAVVFPEVLDSDMNNFRNLATNDTNDSGYIYTPFMSGSDCYFQGAAYNNLMNVYPPGYVGTENTLYPDSVVATRTTHPKGDDNKYHVWYCDGNLYIGNVRVIGQVDFAVKGNTYITGNIYSDSNSADPSLSTYFPGGGVLNRSSSTAHQAVIICQHDVQVTNAFYTTSMTGQQTETIEAMILAPQGKLSGQSYNTSPWHSTAPHANLSLVIKGSLIVGQMTNDPPDNFGSVFQGNNGVTPSRSYGYMMSLKTNPPFYLPALAEIYYSYEETMGSLSIF